MAGEAMNLFEPDSVLPDQFAGRKGVPPEQESVRKLMLAILRDAVDCYQKYALARSPQHRYEFEDARQWIESTDSDWLFSFENICALLDVNPEYVRDGLRRAHPMARRGPGYERITPRIVPPQRPVALDDEVQPLKAAS